MKIEEFVKIHCEKCKEICEKGFYINNNNLKCPEKNIIEKRGDKNDKP